MKWLKVFGSAAAVVLLALGLASCGQGLSVQEAEIIKEDLAQEITQISSRLTDIEAGIEIPEVPEDEPMPADPAGDTGGF